jgi:ketosteroid isomerase-like protein
VSTEVQTLLASLERGYNRGDAEAVAALLAADAVVSLAPWVSPEVSPSSVSLVDRVAAAGTYDERIAFGECLAFDVEIRCDVTFEDEFSDLLRMDPWVQSWVIEVDEGLVRRIDVSGENADRAAAMEGFHEFVDGRPVTGVPPLLAGDLEWNRTVEGAEVYDGFVVFYAAVVGGVPEDAYRLVSDFYDALDRGDTAAAEALFAPGGQYLPTEADDATSAAVYADATAIGSPELTEYFTFWYGMLQTEWHPLDCSGTATEVTCFSESRGLTTLFLPGGVARGSVQFTLSPEGIVAVVDRTVRTGGSCGPAGCGTDAFDIRGFWRAWMHNEPEIETLWPGGNGDPPGGFTAELAQAIIEFYPRFLAENGINVPPEYFDGSPLQGP